MKIRILGAGWFGCHLAVSLMDEHDVEIHEVKDRVFAGASGACPARAHLGAPHYPRSHLTRKACIAHRERFMSVYGHLTSCVPINIYAIAAHDSLVDFGTYKRILSEDTEFLTLYNPAEFNLQNVEGGVMVGERHIVVRTSRQYFTEKLKDKIKFQHPVGVVDDARWDLTIDCTFCANDAANIDRYEPCLTVVLAGPSDRAVTIMDGPFGSLYPWDENEGVNSLTSAKYTPFSKTCRTWAEARALLDGLSVNDVQSQATAMIDQMRNYWREIDAYMVVDHLLSIRAMPRSGSDARLVDVVQVGEKALRVRAGKIDAIFHAEDEIKAKIKCLQ